MKKIAFIALLACACLAFLLYKPRSQSQIYVSASLVEQEQNLLERGHVSPAIKYPVVSGSSGNLLSILPNNTYVKKGDLVASIDNKTILDEIRGLENRLGNYQRYIDLQKITMDLNLKSYDASVRTYRSKLKRSREIYRYEKNKPHPHEVKTMEINRKLAELKLAEDERVLTIEKKLYEKNFISAMAYDKFVKNVKLSKENLRQVITENTSLMKGVDEDKLKVLDQNIENAKVALEKQIEMRKRQEESLNNKLKETQAKIDTVLTDLNYKKKISKQTQILAPEDGYLRIKKKRDWSSGGVFLPYRAGNSVGQNVIIADIINPTKMEVSCTVNESDYDKIKTGMPVNLEFIAYPEQTIKGKVIDIAGLGQDRNNWVDSPDGKSRVYLFEVKIELASNKLKLHPGMSVSVNFKLANKRQHLTIPRSALIHSESGLYVQTYENRKLVKGRVLDHFNFIIEEGISEGEQVLLYPGGNHE